MSSLHEFCDQSCFNASSYMLSHLRFKITTVIETMWKTHFVNSLSLKSSKFEILVQEVISVPSNHNFLNKIVNCTYALTRNKSYLNIFRFVCLMFETKIKKSRRNNLVRSFEKQQLQTFRYNEKRINQWHIPWKISTLSLVTSSSKITEAPPVLRSWLRPLPRIQAARKNVELK